MSYAMNIDSTVSALHPSSSPCWHRTSLLLLACCSMLASTVASSTSCVTTTAPSPRPSWEIRSSMLDRRDAAVNRRFYRRDNLRVSRRTLNLCRGGSVDDDNDDESAGVDVDGNEEYSSLSSPLLSGDTLISTESIIDMETMDRQQAAHTNGEENDDESMHIEPDTSLSDESSSDEHSQPSSKESSFLEKQTQLRTAASLRRAEAKLLHDTGKLYDASLAFHEAASLLREAASAIALVASSSSLHGSDSLKEDGSDSLTVEEREEHVSSILEECATCHLHEALCLLKSGNAGGCVEVCTQVLGDGVAACKDAAMDGGDGVAQDKGNGESTAEDEEVALETTNAATYGNTYLDAHVLPSNVRARAHLRRAKARLALDDFDGALEDAKQSAFMGDRNAVAFYGRLMREGKNGAGGADHHNSLGWGNWGDSMQGTSQNSLLESMLGGNHPFMPSNSGSADFSSSLLSSLLNNGSSASNGNPMGILGELLAPQPETNTGKFRRRRNKKKKNGIDSLAKSLLHNLMKRMENEEMQESICNYLHSTNTQQILQYAALAGVPMKEESAQRLVRLASGITPGGIRKSISNVKRGLKVVRTLRKMLKVIDKYKSIIVLMMLFFWIKSAILEPYPIDRRQAKKLAQKAAMVLVTN